MGRIGFCTTPSRDSAPTSTIDSSQVGYCHETATPSARPRPESPAAARSDASRYSPNVIVRWSSSMASGAFGVASARRSISSHRLLASVIMVPPVVTALRSRRDPAVHRHDAAHHVTGVVGGDVRDQARELLRLGVPERRRHPCELLE